MNGIIFDCKRFAVHDGAGLRSTLFLKGCPLRCPWCQNPEGIAPEPALWHSPQACVRCGRCVAACPRGALRLDERIHVDRARCDTCGRCADACPAAAMQIQGRSVSDREAAELLLRDRVFFGESGGVTLSGGEVLMQWRFAAQVLAHCKDAGVRTAVETCLLAPPQAVEALLPVTDQFLVDIKFLDPVLHKTHLGADNRRILENFERLLAQGADVLVRTPLIPGYTATDGNLRAIARYLRRAAPHTPWELLNFNPLCRSKYAALERAYPVSGGALSAAELTHFYDLAAQEGITKLVKE